MNNEIPPITEPMGKYWEQPATDRIVLDNTHALMEQDTFDRLAEYSCSQPSGAYEGKMWKRHDGSFDPHFLAGGGVPKWLLCWYGTSQQPGMVSVNMREIILLENKHV